MSAAPSQGAAPFVRREREQSRLEDETKKRDDKQTRQTDRQVGRERERETDRQTEATYVGFLLDLHVFHARCTGHRTPKGGLFAHKTG